MFDSDIDNTDPVLLIMILGILIIGKVIYVYAPDSPSRCSQW